ncbi:MAG: putative drug exporter of the superfamily [Solirubrobacterales bacterium]|nr:putative drug exporter of the superfamily [Solirubrobacterales bacterium]
MATGSRGRWLAVAVWLLIGAAGLLAHSRIDDVTAAGQSSFLPADSESTRALDALQHVSGGGEDVPVVIVFERRGGLSQEDLKAIGRDGDGLGKLEIVGATPIVDPFSGEYRNQLAKVARLANGIGPVSRDGEAALLVLAIDAENRGAVVKGVGEIRRYLRAHERPGLHAYVTGPGGIAADLEAIAADAGRTLLLATLGLVLLLLLLVYRAPILALLPLLVVGLAYLVAIGIAYLLIEADWITVNAEGTMLLLVLIFGAGTDYSLLLVHRYREELALAGDQGGPRRSLPKSATEGTPLTPLSNAVRETRPALLASGGTVIAAMLVLLVADLESTHWLGPVLAIGIAVMLAAAFTLLPALLAILGDRAFWPAGPPKPQTTPNSDASRGLGRWERVAGLVRRRSGRIVVGVLALLAVLCLGNLTNYDTLGFGQGVTRATNSSRGTEALERHFPAGLGAPLTAVVKAEEAPAVTREMERLDSVQLVLPTPVPGDAAKAVILLVLHDDPYGSAAEGAVEEFRDRLHAVAPGGLLGGVPVENLDVEEANARDTKLIVPLVLLVVGLILIAVLRALVAPAYLIATVVASFAATLGLATFAFTEVFGMGGLAFNLELMAFIFLVALGVDYNIFLMTRAREEAAARGTKEGVLAALVSTGGVVTGAGLILAGTFATLTLLPLEELVQVGATVAVGVLLDTFVVRALLIPAITYRLGERAWWPSGAGSRSQRGRRSRRGGRNPRF